MSELYASNDEFETGN